MRRMFTAEIGRWCCGWRSRTHDMVQAGETGCAWSVEWAEELQTYAEEVAHLRCHVLHKPLCFLACFPGIAQGVPDL